jgi:hypothetical protein
MTRRLPHPLALALATGALALLPAAASAKEIVRAQVCGADDCATVGRAIAMDLAEGGPPTDPPKEAAPFYNARLTVRVDDGTTETFETAFVPRYGMLRGSDGTWMDAPVQTENAFKRAARNLGAAFPADKLGPLPTPTQAHVVEVVRAPADPAPVDDGSSWWLIASLGLAGVLATWAGVRYVLRRNAGSSPAAPTPPGA